MGSEASVIARKVRNYYKVENRQENQRAYARAQVQKAEPGVIRNVALIVLMGMACLSTKITLFIVRGVRALES